MRVGANGYDPESKQQSCQWKSPNLTKPKRARQVRSSVKTMLISLSLLNDGIGHREMVPPGQAVNQQFYLNVLKRLLEGL